MRYVFPGVLLLSLLANLCFVYRKQASRPPNPWVARDLECRGRTDVFANAPTTPAKILFAGDSIVERCPWSDYLGVPVMNRGVDGDTTEGFIARKAELERHHPSEIIILIGVNDLAKGGTASQVVVNLERIAKLKLAPKCLMLGILDCAGNTARLNPEIAKVNRQIQEKAKDWGVFYVNPPKTYDPTQMTYDTIHPNGHGYRVLAANLKPLL